MITKGASLVCFRGSGRLFCFGRGPDVLSVLKLRSSSCSISEQKSGPYAFKKLPNVSRAFLFLSLGFQPLPIESFPTFQILLNRFIPFKLSTFCKFILRQFKPNYPQTALILKTFVTSNATREQDRNV